MQIVSHPVTAVAPLRRGPMPWCQVILFCALAYGLSWLWWVPMVLPKLGGPFAHTRCIGTGNVPDQYLSQQIRTTLIPVPYRF